jgi:DnaK suppressor protein
MDIQDADAVRDRLTARRAELLRATSETEISRLPVELDQTTIGRLSRMDAVQQQAMALEAERRRSAELARITAALQRIEDGEYGYCLSCGEEIGAKRLELDPSLPTCIACARSVDQSNRK